MTAKGAVISVLLVMLLLGCGTRTPSGTSTPNSSNTKVEHFRPGLQFRWAEKVPGDNLIEKKVLGTEEILYLHEEILLTESDIEFASEFSADEGPAIVLNFTKQGMEKMARLTAKSDGRRLAIVVDGVVITAPRIMGPMSENAKISGSFSVAEAKRLAMRIRLAAQETRGQLGTTTALPVNLVIAWTEAGAEDGWLQWYNLVYFHSSAVGLKLDMPKLLLPVWEVPGFRFRVWTDGTVIKLPQPQQPFGLSLFQTQVTDAGLKELHGLEQLQALSLFETRITDAGLKELTSLKDLRMLDLGFTKVSGVGLKELTKLKELIALNLVETDLSDTGLKELTALAHLQSLRLDRTRVTDVGMKELLGLKRLQWLSLDDTRITDEGVKQLAVLPDLRVLSLSGTKVTDTGLKELAEHKSLVSLSLNFMRVTDAGLKHLVGLNHLRILALVGTPVTDVGLKELGSLKELQALHLYRTQISDAGLRELSGLSGLLTLSLGRTQVRGCFKTAAEPCV